MNRATYVGPAGDRSREAAGNVEERTATIALQMTALAADIRGRAGVVERAQQAWDRRSRELIMHATRNLF